MSLISDEQLAKDNLELLRDTPFIELTFKKYFDVYSYIKSIFPENWVIHSECNELIENSKSKYGKNERWNFQYRNRINTQLVIVKRDKEKKEYILKYKKI